MQKKQKLQKEPELAAVTPLNQVIQEDEEDKETVIIDVDGRVSLEKDEDEPSITNNSSAMTDKTFIKSPHQSQQEYEQDQQLKKQINHDLKECSSCKELYNENLELKEALEKSSQFVCADKIEFTSTHDNDAAMANDILHFEFPLLFRDIRNYMAPLHPKIGDQGKVWFSGKIDIRNRKVISSNLGRIIQQQGRSIDIANRDDL